LDVCTNPNLDPKEEVQRNLVSDLIQRSINILFQIQPADAEKQFHEESFFVGDQVVSFLVPNGCKMVYPSQNVEKQHKYEQIVNQ